MILLHLTYKSETCTGAIYKLFADWPVSYFVSYVFEVGPSLNLNLAIIFVGFD